jgi:hypothetical protein
MVAGCDECLTAGWMSSLGQTLRTAAGAQNDRGDEQKLGSQRFLLERSTTARRASVLHDLIP